MLVPPAYPFAVERDVIAQVEAARKQTFESEEAFQQLKNQYQQDRLNKQKAAARKIAPGFLDTDTRILKPEQTYAQEFAMPAEEEYGSNNTSPQMLQPSASSTTQDKVQVVEASPDKVKK
ncbi:hypothetical protein HPULCUR_005871 [Helicostylum pulchrum]|uniref:Uncharacterized protein n=1 Tax=Helicostylum pulchrum TaxID=562976 RepID=A0ABP9Y0F8_9FUNG